MTDKLATVDQRAGMFLENIRGKLEDCAEREYDSNSFLRSFQQAITESGDLAEFLKNEESQRSLYNAGRYAASTGLSLNPLKGKAALIVRNVKDKKTDKWHKVITYQIMKDGMIDLVMETGEVKYIQCDTVRENDDWYLAKTPKGDDYRFSPARKSRGGIDGYFCAVVKIDGSATVMYMASEEVAEHRKKHSEKSSMPVEGYGLKTIVKKCLRQTSLGGAAKVGVIAEDKSEAEMDVIEGTAVVESPSAAVAARIEQKTEEKTDDDSPI